MEIKPPKSGPKFKFGEPTKNLRIPVSVFDKVKDYMMSLAGETMTEYWSKQRKKNRYDY